MLKFLFVACISFTLFCGCVSLEQIQDDEFLDLIKTEKYVIVLFSRKYCQICDEYENKLTDLQENLSGTLNAEIVKVVDSQLTRLYSRLKEPLLVFFRHGIPLLYDGTLDDDLILHMLTTNKEPVVKELTDETFEHLTQAATGATTGDWFIMFYTTDCIDCQRLQATWETVGAHLKSRMNVARVNKATTGAVTAKRFDVFHVPAFILFRLGKMYRYQLPEQDIQSFVSFAQHSYKNVKPEKVSLPNSVFEEIVAAVVGYFHQIPLWHQICLLSVFLICFGFSFVVILKPYLFAAKSKKTETKAGKEAVRKENKDK